MIVEANNALIISLIFMAGLIGFATDKLRHDLVALLMLAACLMLGLVPAGQAFTGFADPVESIAWIVRQTTLSENK